ncbi:YadA-like family protein [Mesorhizobium sp. KR9-304]|uniref:YadA-like family protein n=1 Tax=Mesorhizobium sp. KR9-304 TaxID=3156614 RepID=UPI0032B520BC
MHRSLYRSAAGLALSTVALLGGGGTFAHSQEAIVSACSGVSLPPSVVTDIMEPVIIGTVVPIEGVLNDLLAVVDLLTLIGLPAPTNVNASQLLIDAASGDPVTLSVLDVDGNIVGPSEECIMTADGVTLDEEKGVSIGGNRITGLGANGLEADAGEINSIAIGNNAATDATALGSIAIGTGATVGVDAIGAVALGSGAAATAANSVALGANSTTTAILSDPAYNPGFGTLAGATASGEVSVGSDTEQRRITNLAAGSAPTDAVNVSQLQAAVEWSIRYDTLDKDVATLEGASGTLITNLADGAVDASSTDAINGSQLFGVSQSIVSHLGGTATVNVDGTITGPTYEIQGGSYTTVFDAFGAVDGEITNINTRIDNIDIAVGEVSDRAVRYDGAEGDPKDTITLEGVGGTTITNLRPGLVDATSTDAVNGSQLHATNVALAELADNAVQYDLDINGDKTNTVTLIGGDPSAPVLVKNVAEGVDDTDAVNVAQLEDGLATTLIQANTYADSLVFNANEEVIEIANAYTDVRFNQLSGEIDGVRDEARQAAAVGLAAASIRYDDTPGKFSVGVGGGFWRGQGAAAFGAGYTSEGGRMRANASAALAGGSFGGGAGLSLTLN